MHIIRDTENKLNPVPEEAIMVPSERNICLCTEDELEGLWTIRIEKIWKKPDPEGIIASDNEMQLDNCGLYHNSSCSLEYDYCSINHTKSKKSWCYLLLQSKEAMSFFSAETRLLNC